MAEFMFPNVSYRATVYRTGYIPTLSNTRHFNPQLVYFYPIFEDHLFDFKEVFSENYVLMYG